MTNPFAPFVATLAADRRLVILRLLVEAGGECGDSVLQKGLLLLRHRLAADRSVVHADLDFLKANDLVVTEELGDRVLAVTITQRGVALTKGAVHVEGVSQPSMGV